MTAGGRPFPFSLEVDVLPLLLACSLALPGSAARALLRPPVHVLPADEVAGSLVAVAVEVDGRRMALHPARDGSRRWYLPAEEGAEYSVQVVNRTAERLGVVLAVDGLNAISGAREPARPWWDLRGPGRMYVLEPWDRVTVRGWRTSLEEVRRFTFVDERASYAARSGKANEKMGWIEVSVFREAGGHASGPRIGEDRAPSEDAGGAAAPAPETGAARAKPAAPKGVGAEGVELGRGRSYPGTGWGERSTDRAVVVEFEPHRRAAERITLRYEYAAALVELGVLPPVPGREDRLADREAVRTGFAPPPVR